MRKILFLLFAGIFLSNPGLAQTSNNSAPVKWQRYKFENQNLSIILPKLPVLIEPSVFCKQEDWKQFAAFAEDVVYGINIINKSKNKNEGWCRNKIKFSEKSFQKRIDEFSSSDLFKNYEKKVLGDKFKVGNKEGLLFKGAKYLYLFVNDQEQNRWYEFWVVNSGISDYTVKKFFDSINFGEEVSGIEVGNGSEVTLGDAKVTSNVSKPEENSENLSQENTDLRIIVKPSPSYTEVARRNNFEGSVMLRVIFLPNGSIGSVTPITKAPYGLTEQAIAASKKIVFIPGKRKGKNIGISKRVQYQFSIF